MIKISLTALGLLLLQSCATSPVDPGQAHLLSKEKIYKYADKKNDKDAKITVVRDSGFQGAACSAGFFINDEHVADLTTSDRIDLYLPSGEYRLGIGPSKNNEGVCTSWPTLQRETMLKDNQEKRFRVSISPYDILPY